MLYLADLCRAHSDLRRLPNSDANRLEQIRQSNNVAYWRRVRQTGLARGAKLGQDQEMLRLPFDCQNYLREDVEEAYPEEACGILLGRREEIDAGVVRVTACGNTDPEPGRRYSIAAAELIAAQRQAREEGLEILGFYHSHPDHPAVPSATDLEEAHWTGCVYLICGVEKGRLAEISAVRLVGQGQWAPEQVQVEPPEK